MVWLLVALFTGDARAGTPVAPPAEAAPAPPTAEAASIPATPLDEEEGAGGALPGGPDPFAGTGLEGVVLPANPGISAVERGPERWTAPAAVLDAVRAVRDRSLGERVEAASRAFLGLPYLNDAAGEFDLDDPDPPSRYDAFDCLTFVEEVLGLALAGDPLYAPGLRDALRYRGAPAYHTRRHFMEAQWIPDAIRNGLVEDITARVGRARVLRKSVTLDTWKRWGRRSLFRLPDALLPVGDWALTYLDLEQAVEAVPRIPAGALVVTLRSERAHKPIVVTHISMVVPPAKEGGEPRMRHATRMGLRTVRDDRLGWYATHLRDYTNWPSLGITVLMPREQGPRISALSAPVLPPPFPPAEGPVPDLASLSWGGGDRERGGGGGGPPPPPPRGGRAPGGWPPAPGSGGGAARREDPPGAPGAVLGATRPARADGGPPATPPQPLGAAGSSTPEDPAPAGARATGARVTGAGAGAVPVPPEDAP